MNGELATILTSDNVFYVHAGILMMLILGGLGFPIPEDIPLLVGGVMLSKEIVSLQGIFLTCYVGVLFGDQTMYLFGYFFGHKLVSAGKRSTMLPHITEDTVDAVREGLRKRRLAYIFLGRHLFPIRSMTFVTAGSLRVPFLEFLWADALAALVSVGIMLYLGHLLGDSITSETVAHIAQQLHYYILATIAVSTLIYLVTRIIRSRRRRAKAATSPHKQSV